MYAAELICLHDCPIVVNMNWMDRFLVRVLHKTDMEVQIAFQSIYDQVCQAETTAFIINKDIIATLYAEIKIIFRQIVQNQVANFYLSVQLENNSTIREVQKNEEEILTDIKRNNTTPVARNLKQKKGLPDL